MKNVLSAVFWIMVFMLVVVAHASNWDLVPLD